ncbi:hypothetical protein GGR51DRAFT_568957 [Nemania sp. FL0031]|nr:hypothetical protein GGR51DRAFT_568957 [Nemania sp. FL0031]
MASPHTSSEFGPISGDMNILGNHFTGSSLTINPPDRNDDYLQHLRRINPRDDKDRIQQIKGGLLEDAYDWILEHADYKRWLDDPNSHLLWVKGDPGKGKTMLLCGVVDELQKSASKSSNPSLVSYFFCQATDQRLNNAKNVLLGLVFLLVNQQKSLLSHFHELYGREGKELFDDINAWVALTRIFRAILADPRLPRTILLVDALDECETDLENLLRLISETSSPASSSKVKWIVSSRYKSMIDEEFRTVSHKIALSLEDNTALISHAVRTYINRKVEDLAARKPYDNSLKNYVESYLIQNANDTFLWVALVCGQLMESQVTTRSTRQRLGSFPPGLDSFYERMLIQIGETDDANRCKRILATTLIAFEPLTIEELRALDDTFRDDTDDDMEAVIANSGSFLTIRDRLVYFVHQSARDFLLNKASHEILPDGVQRKHLSIFSQSLQILSEVLRRDLYDLNNPGIFVDEIHKPSPDPLAAVRYSCVYWVDHFIDGQIHGDMHCELDLRDGGRIYTFIRQKYLYWLEALGLLGHVSHGILSIARLEGLPQMGTQLRDFIRDASRFIQYFKHAIETSPLQVYASGLAFAPEKSKIWDLFQKEMYHWIRLKPNVPPDWNGRLQTLGDGFHALSAAFSPDSKLLASGSNDGKVMVWLVSTGALRHFLEHDGLVWSVAFSPDQKLLASGSSSPNQKVLALEPSSSTVRIWSAVTGALKHHFSDTGDIDLVVFSPDSKMLASCSHGSKVRVWSIATGTLQHALQHREVQSVAFSSSSTLLAAASTNEIQVWSTATGQFTRVFYAPFYIYLESTSLPT